MTERVGRPGLVIAAALLYPALVLGATPKVPPGKIKPYVPPKLEDEPVAVPSDVPVVEVPPNMELIIVSRPTPGVPMVGAAAAGIRLAVRGMWDAPTARGCGARRWYALVPNGWVCSTWVKRTDKPATTEPVLRVPEGERLPFRYVMVGVKDPDAIPMWATLDDLKNGAEPSWQLKKGDTVAVGAPTVRHDGETYFVATDGKVVPTRGTFRMGQGSDWAGVVLDAATPLPFAWVTPAEAKVFDRAGPGAQAIDKVARRDRLPILEDQGVGRQRFIRVGDARWMRAGDLNEVRLLARPAKLPPEAHERWIDIDLGEQVLIAYEGERPVFATLVSSGRAFPTPRGNYPVWAKVSSITMKSQPYEDKTYYVDRVPWALFFQAHNAIHGAYWHDRFGVSKSHGCVNASPRDARWLFEWLPPPLPAGWSGMRTPNLLSGVTVHVRDSHQRRQLVQERAVGPPDRDEEKLKREEADARRQEAAAAAAAGQPPGAGATSIPAPIPPALPTADPR